MSKTTISHVISEFESFVELMDDAYWEASSTYHKDFIYDIIGVFSKEINEIHKLSVQDFHYEYECITEGIRRIADKVAELERRKEEMVPRTKTLRDLGEVLSNVLVILESQNE